MLTANYINKMSSIITTILTGKEILYRYIQLFFEPIDRIGTWNQRTYSKANVWIFGHGTCSYFFFNKLDDWNNIGMKYDR